MTENRRHYSRVKFDADCTIENHGQTTTAHLIDISLKGALIHAPEGLVIEKSDHCIITLALNATDLILQMNGVAVFLGDQQVGFQFKELDIETLTHLRRLVELNYGDSDQVKKELFFMATHEAP